MRAPTHKVDAVQIFKSIARPSMQHLTQIVGEIERRAEMNLVSGVPIGWRDKFFVSYPASQIAHAQLFKLVDNTIAKAISLDRPIHVFVHMSHGCQYV